MHIACLDKCHIHSLLSIIIATVGRTWIVAQVHNKALNSPVLCHVEGINNGPGALRAEVVQAQVADGGTIRQPYQCLHTCKGHVTVTITVTHT